MLIIILLLLGLLALILAAFHIGHPKVNMVAVGLTFWIAATLLPLIL